MDLMDLWTKSSIWSISVMTKDRYDRIRYLADYGKKVYDAKGLSMNIEMVPVKKKLGGNGPIFANSLAKHGFQVTYIGALGKGKISILYLKN